MELKFPLGITGFNAPDKRVEVDQRAFRADCWQVVASIGGKVEDGQQAIDTRGTNFTAQVLVTPGGTVTALLNKFHPWMGFSQPSDRGNCFLDFVDADSVMPLFVALGRYHVLTRSVLEQPINESMCAELGHAELEQLRYWSKLAGRGKLRLGDVVFNFWD